MPCWRQAPRIVVPAGTVTASPSMVSAIGGGASTTGACGVWVARAGGESRIGVSGDGRRLLARDVPGSGRGSYRHQVRLPQRRFDRRRGRLPQPADRGVAHDLADLA